jgi:hypothetical protein
MSSTLRQVESFLWIRQSNRVLTSLLARPSLEVAL